MKPNLISIGLAIGAFFLAACRVNHGLVDSSLPSGSGLTPDESFNALQGYYLFDAFCEYGPLLFTMSGAVEVFGDPQYMHDYPPLGRFALGAAHESTAWLIGGAEATAFNIPAARLGSCFAFALTVLLLCEFTRRNYGLRTAFVTAIALMLMPRVIGHARLASVETMTSLAWLATFLPLWTWWTKEEPPTTRQCIVSGALFGLLLLTKMQGILVPPLVVVWSLWRYQEKAIRPLACWGLTGLFVFFVGWPWLWLDPINIVEYLNTASKRPTLYVWYFGERYADKMVPWHYPFVMTAITVPLVVLIGIVARTWQRKLDTREKLITASVIWPLIVFALPGTPVYDGSRLFLVIMPAVALIAARGLCPLLTTAQRSKRIFLWGVILGLSVWSFGKTLSPFSLDTYSLASANAQGAHWLGMDSSYWVDGLNGDFWEQVPENSTVFVAPVSHQFQLSDFEHLVPAVVERNIKLQPFEYDPQAQRGLVLLMHRLADLPPLLRHMPAGARIVAEVQSEGVVIARLIDTSDNTWPEKPFWPEGND